VGAAFVSALMLTCSFDAAERAVTEAIAMSGPDLNKAELVVASAKCAIDLRDCVDQVDSRVHLPPELGRLFLLSPARRKCFVLRMLLRLSAELSAALMGLRKNEFEEELWQALQNLTFGIDIQSCLQAAEALKPLPTTDPASQHEYSSERGRLQLATVGPRTPLAATGRLEQVVSP
jgi:hypothetical protein